MDLTGRKRTSSPGFVYVLTSRAYPGLCKVGSSKNPLKRLQEFNILDPYRSFAFQDIRFFIRGYHEVERIIHEVLDDRRLEGEWFDTSAQSVSYVLSRIHRVTTWKGNTI